ncbi:MAG: extracellular solute-binding protein [Chloroflexi bacterium]|nr:extracellular solute-binding protein [Chloroflexota bacterium]MBV9602379.1 extracellular solute-binding protein [Chloroflexota bacterium]
MTRSLSRFILAATFVLVACSPPATPAPPTPAPPATLAPQSTGAPGSATEWDGVLAGAKQEGKLVLSTHAGTGYEKYVELVKQALPDLTVDATTIKASDYAARVVVEQQNGQYLWDVHMGPVSNIYTVLTPAGDLEPIKPFLDSLPPDNKDNSLWAGGFELFTDPNNPVTLITEFSDVGGMYVNQDQVPEGINSMDDLLDPKWKGKIAVYDPTVSNGGSMSLAGLLAVKGDAFLQQLINENDAKYVATSNQLTQWVAEGRYPIGFGVDATQLAELQKQGVGVNVVRNRAFGDYSLASGLSVLKNAPHPNAVKEYLNWALSRDGQIAWAQNASVDSSSRRLDVPVFHPDSTPDYQHMEKYPVIQGTASGQDTLDRTLAITKNH